MILNRHFIGNLFVSLLTLCSWGMTAYSLPLPPLHYKSIHGNFFNSIYPRGHKKITKYDEQLSITGQDFTVRNINNQEIKTCTTRNLIAHAVFSPSEKFILTTSNDNVAQVWDRNCHPIFRICDDKDGIDIAIFDQSDDIIVIQSKSVDNLSKIWLLPPHELQYPIGAQNIAYMSFLGDYCHHFNNNRTYNHYIKFFMNSSDESIIFNRLSSESKRYLRALIPGRPEAKL